MNDPDRNGLTGDEDEVFDQELLATLAAVNPVDPADVPGPDSPQARALFLEITMETTTPRWSRPATLTALAAALAAAVVGLVLFVGNDPAGDTGPVAEGPNDEPPPIAGMCAELYTLDALANREFAFDGTLVSVDGDNMTFDVTEVFRGDIPGDSVTLGGATLITEGSFASVEGAGLAVGDRALVSGDGGFAWGCGFTMPWDEATAADWRTTLG